MSTPDPQVISGRALLGEDLTLSSVNLIINKGRITAIEDAPKVPDIWICPALFNAHTHLGDTVAMDCGDSCDLVSLVTPPHGLKHQILRKTVHADLVRGMRQSIQLMVRRGTAGCADFREGGVEGVYALNEAAKGQKFRSIIFGRDGGETVADGLGVSSARDVPDAERIVERAKQMGRKVAFHAGEKDSGDIDAALAFDPDLIIHATHATDAQLKKCAENDIPLAVCPRSNWALSVTDSPNKPPIRRMIELGCRVFLGTDNVMIVQPDLLAEMAFLSTIYHIRPVDVLRMAVEGSVLCGDSFFIKQGARANLFILDPRSSNLSFSKDPVAGIINRAFSIDNGKNVFNL